MMARALLVLTAVGLSSPAAAQSLRCEGRLVGRGDTAHALRARCGEPAHVATRLQQVSVGALPLAGAGVVQTTREPVETWIYPPKDGELARVVTLRRGRVTRVEAVAGLNLTDDPGCARHLLRRRATVGEVELSCGAPADRAEWEEETLVRGAQGQIFRRVRTRTRWVYDPGPGRLLRVLEFVDGRLEKIDTGARSPS